MNETKIYINKDNVETEYDLLITFKNTKNNQDYAIYTDDMLDEDGKTKVYATTYIRNSDGKYIGVSEPTTQEEWDEVINVLKKVNNLD